MSLRMFAGPNGSGKSTIKSVVPDKLLGVYLNPDEMQKDIEDRGFLNVRDYGVETTRAEILAFFADSTLLRKARLEEAQPLGYRAYLYYIATDDPAINVARVKTRVNLGGHDVPEDKITQRYQRSLDLLMSAIKHTKRAYLFDNSREGGEKLWVAEITDGCDLELKCDPMPDWFRQGVWEKI